MFFFPLFFLFPLFFHRPHYCRFVLFDDLIVFFFNILFASSCQDNPSEKDANQGTLVVFNLDSSVSTEELHQIFGIYGEIREVRL